MPATTEMYVSRNGAWEKYYIPEPVGVQHNTATNRDAPDSHPISAIEELESILQAKSDTEHTHPFTTSVVSPSAPANPATGVVWVNTSNNSIKIWSGSAWVSPKYRVGSAWDSYRDVPAAVPTSDWTVSIEEAHMTYGAGGADFAAWGFDGDTQGWTTGTGYTPFVWRPGAIDLPKDQVSSATNRYSAWAYSPYPDIPAGTMCGGWVVMSCNNFNGGVDHIDITINLYYDGLKSVGVRPTIYGGMGATRFDIPGQGVLQGFAAPNFQITSYGYQKASGQAQTIVPKYWNGSAWIPQSAV